MTATHSDPLEIWNMSVSIPRWSARQGKALEALGFDGMTVSDSQCLSADPYVTMMSILANTETLRVAPSVTNPVTRHPSITANAIASLQAESGGRAALMIGRGDSALAHLGYAPASVQYLEDYVAVVQSYLRGDSITFDRLPVIEGLKPVESLALAGAPTASHLEWLRPDLPKADVMITASGPLMIRAAARVADGVNFAVGADPGRITWAIGEARKARELAGLDPDGIRFGAYVSVLPEADREKARRMIAGDVASFARFSVMHGKPVGPGSAADDAVLTQIHQKYDMGEHFRETSPQAGALTDDFIDAFAIAGDASYCIDRLLEIMELGITRLLVSTGARGSDRSEAERARSEFAHDIAPVLRSSTG